MRKGIVRRRRGAKTESVYVACRDIFGPWNAYKKYQLIDSGIFYKRSASASVDVLAIPIDLLLIPILPKHTEELERFVARARMLDRNFKFKVADEDTCRKERMLYKEWLRKSAVKNTNPGKIK